MRAFIQFEASSLGRDGYPIEVAWVLEDGSSEWFLIAPANGRPAWDAAAEALHGISQDQLTSFGASSHFVARRLVDALRGHRLYTACSAWAGRWLSLLLRSGGLPADAVALADTDEALLELASAVLAPLLPSSQIQRAARKILAYAGDRFVSRRPAHRALPDARFERERWLIVSDLAHAYGGRAASQPHFWQETGQDRASRRNAVRRTYLADVAQAGSARRTG